MQRDHEGQERLLPQTVRADQSRLLRKGLLWGSSAQPVPSETTTATSPATGSWQPTRSAWVRDLSMLVRVFFWRGLFLDRRWLFPLVLVCGATSYEVAASTILNIIGDFYLAISSRDTSLFLKILWRSLLVVTLVAVLKAVRDLAKEACALVWRQGLVSFLHSWYISGKTPYVLSTAEAGRLGRSVRGKSGSVNRSPDLLDNPDQRVTADVDALTTAFADVVHATLVVPGLVVFYTWYLVGMFGWTAPLACYLYFVVASTVNWAVVKRVVPAVYKQERAEGTFRYDHAWLRTHAESVAFCGVAAIEGRERERLQESFDAVVTSRWLVIRRHVPLYVLTQFFDYLGSIINYAAVGGAIVYLSNADGKSEAEISALLARGSYSCLYLINAFSQALRASEAASRVGGSAGRVAELLRGSGYSDNDARGLGPWSIGFRTSNPATSVDDLHGADHVDQRRNARTPGGPRNTVTGAHFSVNYGRLAAGPSVAERNLNPDEESGLENPSYSGPLPSSGSTVREGGGARSPRHQRIAFDHSSNRGPHGHATGSCDTADWLLQIVDYSVAQPEYNDVPALDRFTPEAPDGPRPPFYAASGRGDSDAGAIVRGLTFTICRGQHVLITGPSGCGKTSLLRSIAGLWKAETGTLELAPNVEAARRAQEAQGIDGRSVEPVLSHGGVMFLPQRTYCFRGTLLEQVTYPSRADDVSMSTVETILTDLGLAHLIALGGGTLSSGAAISGDHVDSGGRRDVIEAGGGGGAASVDTSVGRTRAEARTSHVPSCGAGSDQRDMRPLRRRDWASMLSIGEQQRLGIARVLYHRPALAFMDESLSAVTETAEKDAYELLRRADVTVVAVGHRSSLRALHARILSLTGAPDGRWQLSDA